MEQHRPERRKPPTKKIGKKNTRQYTQNNVGVEAEWRAGVWFWFTYWNYAVRNPRGEEEKGVCRYSD